MTSGEDFLLGVTNEFRYGDLTLADDSSIASLTVTGSHTFDPFDALDESPLDFDFDSVKKPDLYFDLVPKSVGGGDPSSSSSKSSCDGGTYSDRVVFDYINEILMEENVDESTLEHVEPSIIDATEKSLLDALNDSSSCSSGSVFGQLALPFSRGIEVANKLIPTDDQLVIRGSASPTTQLSYWKHHCGAEDICLGEQRSKKQQAIASSDESLQSMFDKVLLVDDPPAILKKPTRRKGSVRSRRKNLPEESVAAAANIEALLIECAQAVSEEDRGRAAVLLEQIRRHSSPRGVGAQRMAHYFAEGLEARLAGVGSQIYRSMVSKKRSAADVLQAIQLFFSACPFQRVSHFFANFTIIRLAENAQKLHIVDFGIFYGFQWPSFMQFLAERPIGPPKLRITGIDVPQMGLRPSELVDETGARLAGYARRYNIQFEYHAITAKLEEVRQSDIKLKEEEDELLVVCSMFRFHLLGDEAVSMDCARDKVLKTIRELNPAMFIMAIINGGFTAPLFVARFREALLVYSSLFDLMEKNVVGAEEEERVLVERELLGRDIVNVVACEGEERVQRQETYKQFHGRAERAGFEVVKPMVAEAVNKAKKKVEREYHKDFMVQEDACGWLLQGWKGRINVGVSCWKPRRKMTKRK